MDPINRAIIAFLIGALSYLAGVAHSNAQAQKTKAHLEGPPEQFSFGEGGVGMGYTLELRNQEFWLDSSTDNDRHKKRHHLKNPSLEKWAEFWMTVDKLKVWKWARKYKPAPHVIVNDGANWELKIIKQNHRVDSSGEDSSYPRFHNAPPPRTQDEVLEWVGEDNPYKEFTQALLKLFDLENKPHGFYF